MCIKNINIKVKILIIFLLLLFTIFLINKIYKYSDELYLHVNNINYMDNENIEKNNLYTDLISEYETRYNEQNINRSTNIKLAADKINGTIILSGEIFSYNSIVGNRTELAGFKSAPMYEGGKIVNGIGGGVCQVSSTLYNVALYANLEIIERKSHQFLPVYIQPGRDATVTDEYTDFKFKNTRKYPIKIICSANEGVLKIAMYGVREREEYDIEIQSLTTEVTQYKTIYEYDNTMEKGTKVVAQVGKNGYKSNTYKIIKLNGEILSKELISTDTYNVINEIIKVGTKEYN